MSSRIMRIALLLGPLAVAGPSLAAEARPHVTVLGGMSVSKLRDAPDPYDVLQSLKGLSAGVGLAWSIAPSWELQPQLLYVEKGVSCGEQSATTYAGTSTGTFETLNVTGSLEVPVLVRFGVPTGGRIRPVLMGGPFVSFELSEKMKLTGGQESSQDAHNLKGTDIGVAFGAGLEVNAGPGRWVLEGRYDLGTVELNPDGSHSGALLLMTGTSDSVGAPRPARSRRDLPQTAGRSRRTRAARCLASPAVSDPRSSCDPVRRSQQNAVTARQ